MKIQNSTTIKEVRKAAGLSISEGFPQDLSAGIVPTIEINPMLLRRAKIGASGVSVATGALTIYTTSSDKQFYLCSISGALFKNSSCDQATGVMAITTTINGASVNLMGFPTVTLGAQTFERAITFNPPLKIDKGVTISFPASYTLGVMVRDAEITGYEVEPFEDI